MTTHGALPRGDGATAFGVWAPHAETVTLELGGRSLPLEPQDGGWFRAEARAQPGDRYAYRLDAGPPRPDPASRRQPDGVHGPSAVVDPGSFEWSDEAWEPPGLEHAVVYELHVGTFTPEGTFAAAHARLAGLAELGITHVEVMPVNAFNGERGWGYDGVAWNAVHEPYGGPAGFAALVDACHGHGIGVILDVVYNHLGPSGNYLGEFGPYLTDRYRTPWGEAVNLDGPGSDEVRAFILGNATQWLVDYHVDGLRLDAVHALIDNSATHILAELADTAAAAPARTGARKVLIAESDRSDPATVLPRDARGLGMDAQWADDLHHAIHTALTGERDGYYIDYAGLPDVAAAYRRGFLFDGRYSRYRQRTVGAPLPDTVPGHRLVSCLQNHDQVGNRARGERLTSLVDPGLVRVGIVLLCAAPTTPLLFMGEEFGEERPFCYFTSHPEPELAEAVRRGRQEEFSAFTAFGEAAPDPQDPETFSRSRLDWVRADTPPGRARRRLWSDALQLRRSHPALADGRRDLVTTLLSDDHRLALVKGDPSAAAVLVTANLGAHEACLPAPALAWRPALSTEDPRYGGGGADATMRTDSVLLPPRTAVLWTTPSPLSGERIDGPSSPGPRAQ